MQFCLHIGCGFRNRTNKTVSFRQQHISDVGTDSPADLAAAYQMRLKLSVVVENWGYSGNKTIRSGFHSATSRAPRHPHMGAIHRHKDSIFFAQRFLRAAPRFPALRQNR